MDLDLSQVIVTKWRIDVKLILGFAEFLFSDSSDNDDDTKIKVKAITNIRKNKIPCVEIFMNIVEQYTDNQVSKYNLTHFLFILQNKKVYNMRNYMLYKYNFNFYLTV